MITRIDIPTYSGPVSISLSEYDNVLFILGTNGSGKSALLQYLYQHHHHNACWVAAHRQIWFESGQLNVTSRNYHNETAYIKRIDTEVSSRYIDQRSSARPNHALFALLRAKLRRDLEGTTRLETVGHEHALEYLDHNPNPIEIINGLFRDTSLDVRVEIDSNDPDALVARRVDSSSTYGIEQLSDGERSAVLLASAVLTAPKGSLLLLDEPERHMHRSITSPLLSGLFSTRHDCNFVISTHDLLLPHNCGPAPVLVLRSCTFESDRPSAWDADLLDAEIEIDDDLKVAVWGSRRTILCVEGTRESLDKPLYEAIFPDTTVRPTGNRDEVIKFVNKAAEAESLHWLNVFGLIDRDRLGLLDEEFGEPRRIYTLNRYAVESLYYDPRVQRAVAIPRARQVGEDVEVWLSEARDAAIAVADRREPLTNSQDERTLRRCIVEGDLNKIISDFPIAKSAIPFAIAKQLGFRNRREYEKAVRVSLRTDEGLRNYIAQMCGGLQTALQQQPTL